MTLWYLSSRSKVIPFRAGASGPVGPVLAGPISVRQRGRVKLCTNAIVSVSMRKRRRTHTRVKLNVRAGSRSRRGRVDQIWPDQRKCASAGPALPVYTPGHGVA